MALSEVERLRGVVLSQQSDQRFDSDIALAKALLGNDLRLDQLRDVRMSGPLRKQSDYIKQWNARFFVLVGRFLLYYTEKKEDALPNGAMLLTTVTVAADDNIKKVRCSPGCLGDCGMDVLRAAPSFFAFRLRNMRQAHGFRVKSKKVEYILAAQTEAERRAWISAIEAASQWWSSSTFDERFQAVLRDAAEVEAVRRRGGIHFDDVAESQRPDADQSDDD